MDDDHFVLAKLEHAVTLLALLIVIEEMEFNDVGSEDSNCVPTPKYLQ